MTNALLLFLLLFTASLTDPIEPFRDTRLKIYLENNGKTLYTTNPNDGFEPLRLNQNQPVNFDGFVLQPYLQPEALVGVAGQGQGSVIMPEGLNRIGALLRWHERDDHDTFCLLDWILPLAWCALLLDDLTRNRLIDKIFFRGPGDRIFLSTGFDDGDYLSLTPIT